MLSLSNDGYTKVSEHDQMFMIRKNGIILKLRLLASMSSNSFLFKS